jgi:cytochrome c553
MMKLNAVGAMTALTLSLVSAGAVAGPLEGDPGKAAPIADQLCASCHGKHGDSAVPGFPKLAGQTPEYLLHEMREYKRRHRDNAMMSHLMKHLSDQDLVNLALYYAQQKPTPAAVSQPELLAAGKKLYFNGNPDAGVTSCDGCHGENGHGSAQFPRLAGQNVAYILDQFKQYREGKRRFGMRPMLHEAQRMTQAEINAVAEYIASMP